MDESLPAPSRSSQFGLARTNVSCTFPLSPSSCNLYRCPCGAREENGPPLADPCPVEAALKHLRSVSRIVYCGAIVEGRAGVVKRQHDSFLPPKIHASDGKIQLPKRWRMDIWKSAGRRMETAADMMGFEIGQAEGGKEEAEEKGEQGVETRSAPEEGTDVEGGKARRRARLESTARKAKAQVCTRLSASHTSAYVHTPSTSSISGGSKRLHGKKETSAEREEGSKTGRR
ncbi:hypothetical protein B0H14DRAFT_2588934 [Mycena olivaceomarginata]|nr:hypothetical protein B0H14DRAFT_2588934 [Mycena olivaceomarginata]